MRRARLRGCRSLGSWLEGDVGQLTQWRSVSSVNVQGTYLEECLGEVSVTPSDVYLHVYRDAHSPLGCFAARAPAHVCSLPPIHAFFYNGIENSRCRSVKSRAKLRCPCGESRCVPSF